MKYRIVFFSFFIFLSILLFFYIDYNSNIFSNKDIKTININEIDSQIKIDKNLNKFLNDDNYTIKNPKIVLNPYKISPLTALIIFQTKEETEISVFINGKYATKVEKSTKHIIPIYGLISNYNNEIKFVTKENTEFSHYIKTDSTLLIYDYFNYTNKINNDMPIFLLNSIEKFALDSNGKVCWDLKIEQLDLFISENKELYYIDNYSRIIETDFFGKIKKIYQLDIKLDSHHITKIENGNFIVISSDNTIYEIDYKTGKVVNEYNFFKIFKSIDSNFEIKNESIYLNLTDYNKDMYINYVDYNEKDNYMIISIRGISTIVKYNLSEKNIEWIFTNNNIFSEKFDSYKLNLASGRYPLGQHTVYLKNDLLYLFNNDYDGELISNDNIGNRYSSASIYKINNKSISQIYEYKGSGFSSFYGSFYELKNENKLINFGNLYDNIHITNINSKVVIVNNENNVDIEIILKNGDSIYKAFENDFYNETTPNYNLDVSKKIINGNLYIKKYEILNNYKKLKNALTDEAMLNITNRSIDLKNANLKLSDNAKIIFVDNFFTGYEFDYINKEENFYNNIFNYLPYLYGKYAIFVKINDEYYNTNKIINIKSER